MTRIQLIYKTCPACNTLYDGETESCARHEDVPLKTEHIDLDSAVISAKYKLDAVIGRGAMSTVIKATDSSGRTYAIKVLDSAYAGDSTQLKRFEQEAAILAEFNHPNLVAVHEFDSSGSRPYIVMDYVSGRSLAHATEIGEDFPLLRCMRIFKQTCEAMAHAHTHGVIHRDLKPGNILLQKKQGKDHVKIVDFGVAKYFGQNVDETTIELGLTRTPEVFGTSIYMSPEQALGRDLDPRCDIYSLGCIMFELIAGRPPFTGVNAVEILHKHINEAAPDLQTICGATEIPPQLARIIQRTLEKRPEARPVSMLDLLRSLDAVIAY